MGGAWRTISVALRADASGYLGPVAAASAATRKLGDETDASAKRASGGWDSLSKVVKVGAAGMVLGIGAFIGASIKAAADFEQRMSAIGAVTGATGGQMEDLRKKALQLGADTAFSASDAARAMEELAKAGVPVEGILNGAADATVALAAAGGIDLPQAAAIAANAMNQFGLSAQELPHVADEIAGAANASAIDVSDFGLSMSQAGAVAHLVGLSFDDTALAITAMGNAGIKGSDAGTSLKTFLMNLEPSSVRASNAMKSLGIITEDGGNKFFDATGKVKSMAEISDVLGGALRGMTKEQQLATLSTLFGSDAIRAAGIVAGEGAAGFNQLSEKMASVSAADVAAQRMNNLKGSLEQLKGSVETLMIQVGSKITPFLKDAADGATSFVNALGNGGVGVGALSAIFDMVQRAEPAWRGLVDTIGNLGGILAEAARYGAPIAGMMAGIAAGAVILGLNGVMTALSGITGFLKEHPALIHTVTGALLAMAAVQAFNALIGGAETFYLKMLMVQDAAAGSAIAGFLGGLAGDARMLGAGIATMGSDARTGFGMVKDGAGGLAGAFATPLVGVAAFSLAVVGVFQALDHANQKAKEFADSLSKGVDPTNLNSLQKHLDDARPAVDDMVDKWHSYDGVLGNTKATFETLNPFMSNGFLDSKKAAKEGREEIEQMRIQAQKLGDTINTVSDRLGMSGKDVQGWIDKLNIPPNKIADIGYVTEKIRDANTAAREGAPAAGDFAGAIQVMGEKSSTAKEKVDALKNAMDALVGAPMSAYEATRKYQGALDELGKAMFTNGASIDINTEKGRAMSSALTDAIQSARDNAEAVSQIKGPDAARESFISATQEIYKTADALGVPKGQLDALYTQFNLWPQDLNTNLSVNDQASAKLAETNAKKDAFGMQVTADLLANSQGAVTSLDDLHFRFQAYVNSNPQTRASIETAPVMEKTAIIQGLLQQWANSNPSARAYLDANPSHLSFTGLYQLSEAWNAQTPQAKAGVDAGSANSVLSALNTDLTNLTNQQRVARVVAEAITGQAEYGLAGVTDRGRVAQILAAAQTAGADLDLNTTAGRMRIAAIIAQAGGVPAAEVVLSDVSRSRIAILTALAITNRGDADLNDVAGRQRVANIIASAITGQAQYGLSEVTDKKRVADIIAQALTGQAGLDLNTEAGRQRLARIVAQADLGAAPGQLDGVAHGRTAPITAVPDTGRAEGDLNNTARGRSAVITATAQFLGNWNPPLPALAASFAPGSFGMRWGGINSYATGGIHAHVARNEMIRYAEPRTGGEAFVPRHGDQWRSLSVLGEAAGWYGASVVPKQKMVGFAGGGIASSMPAMIPMGSGSGGVAAVTNININVTGNGDQAIADIVHRELVPAVEAQTDRVAKILVRRGDAVAR